MRAFTRSALLSLGVLVVAAGNALAGHESRGSHPAPSARVTRRAGRWLPVDWTGALTDQGAGLGGFVSGGAAAGASSCRPAAVVSRGYVNPVAQAALKRERIDQGVDYSGSGHLIALGRGTITYVGTDGTGWPGAFLEYRLLDGPEAGCFVYYAEGITPAPGLEPGQTVAAGQVLARIIPWWPTGLELGWGAGVSTKTYAAQTGTWTAQDDADNTASGPGKSFSTLIARLGGPPGKVEG